MKQKKGARGSLLDLFLIFLFLFCLLGVLFRRETLRRDEKVDGTTELLAVMEVSAIDPRMLDALSEGELLYRDSGEPFGVLIAIDASPTSITLIENGVAITGEWDPSVRCDLRLTVSFFGTEKEGRVLHGGTRPLSVGQSLTCYSERAALQLRILQFSSISSKTGN